MHICLGKQNPRPGKSCANVPIPPSELLRVSVHLWPFESWSPTLFRYTVTAQYHHAGCRPHAGRRPPQICVVNQARVPGAGAGGPWRGGGAG